MTVRVRLPGEQRDALEGMERRILFHKRSQRLSNAKQGSDAMKNHLTRRGFIRHATAGSAALTWLSARRAPTAYAAETAKPAMLGGAPVHQRGWPEWPTWRQEWEPAVLKVLRSRQWYRGSGNHVAEFEKSYAQLLGAKRCLATSSGTTALLVSLHVMDVQAGDEVIVSPYTFIATYNAILINKALPVFADTDPATLTRSEE